MKLLDKKRIKIKKGEHLALNERNMLAKVGAARGEAEEWSTRSLFGDSQQSQGCHEPLDTSLSLCNVHDIVAETGVFTTFARF